MTEDIKFSVTVPAYKAQFLGECIDSILAQTYKNFEVIIVNDASPQDLDSIVNRYDDPRIHYYKNKVGFGAEHAVGNWNKCLEYATGDYIICMGDDDKLFSNCLEEYSKLIRKYPGLGLYHGWTVKIDENSIPFNIVFPSPEMESCYSLIYSKISGRDGYIGDYLFEAKLLRENGGFSDFPFGWGSDDMSVYIAASRNGLANTQVPVFQYRVSRYSISSSTHIREKMEALTKQFEWINNFMLQDNNEQVQTDHLVRDVCLSSLPSLFRNVVTNSMLNDLESSGRIKGLIYWLGKRFQYNIPTKMIFKMFIKSFRRVLRHKP